MSKSAAASECRRSITRQAATLLESSGGNSSGVFVSLTQNRLRKKCIGGTQECRRSITRQAATLLESSGGNSSNVFVSLTQNRRRKRCIGGTRERGCSKIMTRQAAKLATSGDFVSRPRCRQAKKLINANNTSFELQKKLDTNMFELYLEHLWGRISVEKRISYAYLDCLWFSLYKDGSAKSKVLEWIKRKKIFSRKYTFIPIVCWRHWSLLILCHFGGRKSKTNQPCMLLLDSLQELNPKRLELGIRKFVLDIYRSEGRKEKDEFISKIPLLIPKVPQQRSAEECGIFVLFFLNLFVQTAPDSFNQEGYPCFLDEDWFKLEDLKKFEKEIHELCIPTT